MARLGDLFQRRSAMNQMDYGYREYQLNIVLKILEKLSKKLPLLNGVLPQLNQTTLWLLFFF